MLHKPILHVMLLKSIKKALKRLPFGRKTESPGLRASLLLSGISLILDPTQPLINVFQ